MKGISGRRKSKDTPHRRRCLRVDKRSERQLAKKNIVDSIGGLEE